MANPALKLHEVSVSEQDGAASSASLDAAPSGRLIRRLELFERMGVSPATGHRLAAAGKIGPRPIRLAGVRYDLDEVLAWFRHRRPDGSLHDAKTWPTVWAAFQKGGRPCPRAAGPA